MTFFYFMKPKSLIGMAGFKVPQKSRALETPQEEPESELGEDPQEEGAETPAEEAAEEAAPEEQELPALEAEAPAPPKERPSARASLAGKIKAARQGRR